MCRAMNPCRWTMLPPPGQPDDGKYHRHRRRVCRLLVQRSARSSPVEKVEMNNVSISFAENAGAGHAAMMCGAAECSKLAIWAENVKEIHFHNVKLEGYAGERLNFINVGSFKEVKP